MKRISVRIGVVLLAFLVTMVASTIKTSFSVDFPKTEYSPMSRSEEWHRLYEAAGMSGDSMIKNEVNDRLFCTNKAGLPDARGIEIKGELWCQRADGSIHQFLVNDSSEYGSFFKSITSSHSTWALENLDFVRSISDEKSAKDYVATHRSLFD